MKKKALFIAAIVSGLLLITNTHLQHPLGDNLFELIGLSPWTKANQNGLLDVYSVCDSVPFGY